MRCRKYFWDLLTLHNHPETIFPIIMCEKYWNGVGFLFKRFTSLAGQKPALNTRKKRCQYGSTWKSIHNVPASEPLVPRARVDNLHFDISLFESKISWLQTHIFIYWSNKELHRNTMIIKQMTNKYDFIMAIDGYDLIVLTAKGFFTIFEFSEHSSASIYLT